MDARGFVVESNCKTYDEGEEASKCDGDDDPGSWPDPEGFAIERWPDGDVGCGGSSRGFLVKGLKCRGLATKE